VVTALAAKVMLAVLAIMPTSLAVAAAGQVRLAVLAVFLLGELVGQHQRTTTQVHLSRILAAVVAVTLALAQPTLAVGAHQMLLVATELLIVAVVAAVRAGMPTAVTAVRVVS
jgi:hypothetical protein